MEGIIKIEKGIKIPTDGPKVGPPLKYPWNDMSHGDSFKVICKNWNERQAIFNSGQSYFKSHHIDYMLVSKKIGNNAEGKDVIRFWCVNKKVIGGE